MDGLDALAGLEDIIEGSPSQDMSVEVSKLCTSVKGLLSACPGKQPCELNDQVTPLLANWYKSIKDIAFLSWANPSPMTVAGQNCFNSFGAVRGAKVEVEAQQAAMTSKMQQADSVVESTMAKMLAGPQNTPANRAAITTRMAEFKKKIHDECHAGVVAATTKASKAEEALNKAAQELLALIEADHASEMKGIAMDEGSLENMMRDMEAQFQSLELGAGPGATSGTGGTSHDSSQDCLGFKS